MEQPFDADLFGPLAALEERNFWFLARNRLILWTLERWFPHMRSFLEIGCGTGFVLEAVARAHPDVALAASDMYPEALTFAGARVPRAELFVADARTLERREWYDVVGAFDVVEHIDDDLAALTSMGACVRPGGGLVLTVPQHPFLWSEFDDASHHVRRYRPGELERRVRQAGLTVVHTTSFVSLLLPALAVARLTSRARHVTVESSLEQAETFGRPFSAAMRAELALLRRGVRFPAGGSRLVVARRDA